MPKFQASHYTSLLQSGSWFNTIDTTLQHDLIDAAEICTLERGTTLFSRGDAPSGLYAVVEGNLRISAISLEGKEAILTFVDPPNWIGEVSLFDNQPRTHNAIAEADSVLLHIPQTALDNMLQSNPAHWRYFGLLLTQKLRLTFYAIEDFALLPAPQRLIRRLTLIAEGYGNWQDQSQRVIKLQQEQLGRMLSISRQTTNQILKDLETKSLIKLVYGGIEILDLDALRQLGGVPPITQR
jgi:CRP/FNR family cyclic AMP-dependent transcriptional regulator